MCCGNRIKEVEKDTREKEKFNRVSVCIYIMWIRKLYLSCQNKDLSMSFKIKKKMKK